MPAPSARMRRTYMRRRALFEGPSSPETGGARRADEELLDVGEDAQLVAELGQLAAQLGRELRRQRRLEQRDAGARRAPRSRRSRGRRAATSSRTASSASLRRRAERRRPAARSGAPSSPSAPGAKSGSSGSAPRRGSAGSGAPRAPGRRVPGSITSSTSPAATCWPRCATHLLHDARDGRVEADLHLHGFEHAERLADLDAIARAHVDRDHHRRRSRAHVAGGLAARSDGRCLRLRGADPTSVTS